jgi:glutaconate CoA-transferase subunit B
MAPASYSRGEFLAAVLARGLQGARTAGVGTNSPVPAAAALLAHARSGGAMDIAILGLAKRWPFTDGGRELFDFAGQGRLDAFFLGGGQIDGAGNLNLVSVGGYPAGAVRFPGSYGSAYLCALVPNTILFREEHSPRVLVERVDFISARGVGPGGAYRKGGPRLLVTGRAVFRFDTAAGGFALSSFHPGESAASIRRATGFAFAVDEAVPETPPPDPEDLALLRGPIAAELRALYPRFAARELSGAPHA